MAPGAGRITGTAPHSRPTPRIFLPDVLRASFPLKHSKTLLDVPFRACIRQKQARFSKIWKCAARSGDKPCASERLRGNNALLSDSWSKAMPRGGTVNHHSRSRRGASALWCGSAEGTRTRGCAAGAFTLPPCRLTAPFPLGGGGGRGSDSRRPAKNQKSQSQKELTFLSGAEGTRTLDLRRDRPAF